MVMAMATASLHLPSPLLSTPSPRLHPHSPAPLQQLFLKHGFRFKQGHKHKHKQGILLMSASTSQSSTVVIMEKGFGKRDTDVTPGKSGCTTKVEFWKPSGGSRAAAFCDSMEKAVVWAFDAGLSEKRAYLLSDNYVSVPEMAPVADLPIVGSILECMNGEFVRVGPNPRFKLVSGYHWFDGDGMIHGLNIKNGKATYVAWVVRMVRLQQGEYYGAAKFMKATQT